MIHDCNKTKMRADTCLPKRILCVQESIPCVLLQYMGIDSLKQDPATANANWDNVLQRLNSHPHEARTISGLSYPLNLALCNRVNPVPAVVVHTLIECYPVAFMEEDIGNACRNKHTRGETMRVLILRSSDLFSGKKEIFKRWDLDWIACNNNREAAKEILVHYNAANFYSLQDWKEIRPSNHTFWFSILMELGSPAVSKENIHEERILQFFILQGNYTNVKLILDTYPDLIETKICTEDKRNQLPLHTALSSENPNEYRSWHNRSQIVRLLLEYGIRKNVGGDDACGGLWTTDSHNDALGYAIESAINYPWVDSEREKSLHVCLQFAQASLYDRSCHSVDLTLPILHAAIGIVCADVFSSIIEKYGESILTEVDRNGSTALFQLIAVAGERPMKGYAATRNILKLRTKEFDRTINRAYGYLLDPILVVSEKIWNREKELFRIQPCLSCFDLVGKSRASTSIRLLDLAEKVPNDHRINQSFNQISSTGFDFRAAVILYDKYMNILHILKKSNQWRGDNVFRPVTRGRLEHNAELQYIEENSDANVDVIGEMTPDQIEVLKTVILEKMLEMDQIEERIIERTYFTCICCILLIKTRSKSEIISSVKNRKGRFPLHEAVLKCTSCVEHILYSFPEALSESDPETLLFPFATVAASSHENLSFSYKLLLEQPTVIDQIISDSQS